MTEVGFGIVTMKHSETGRPVVAGVFQYVNILGMRLGDLMRSWNAMVNDISYAAVVCLPTFCQEALAAGWSQDRVLATIHEALTDTGMPGFADRMDARLRGLSGLWPENGVP